MKLLESSDTKMAQQLIQRGGPYSPTEYSAVSQLDPSLLVSAKYRTITPSRSPEEVEVERLVAEKFGARLIEAEQGLTAAIDATRDAWDRRHAAAQKLARLESTTWLSDGHTHHQRAGGTAEQAADARAEHDDAARAYTAAASHEGAARVKHTVLGQQMTAHRRQLVLTMAAKKK